MAAGGSSKLTSGIAYLDLCGPATLTNTAQGDKIALGHIQASLDVAHASDSIDFRWYAGAVEIEFSFDDGDEAILKAKREITSTAC